jgi:hypothetical protein
MIGILLKYDDFFTDSCLNKFDLIANIPRDELVTVYSSLNYILKEPLSQDFNHSLGNQIKIIKNIFKVKPTNSNIKECAVLIKKLFILNRNKKDGELTIVSRTSCLFALSEVIYSSEIKKERTDRLFNGEDFLNIFKFLLLCNDELLDYSESYNTEFTVKKLGSNFFEAFMFKEIPNNQYTYIQNPINLLERSRLLISYVNSKYSRELQEFTDKFQVESPTDFLSIIANNFFSNSGIAHILAYKVDKKNIKGVQRMDALTVRGRGKAQKGLKKFEFLGIKKSPLYKVDSRDYAIYVTLDSTFLIEKCYELFFWDFFFDTLSPKGIRIEDWGGFVGYFFEDYSDYKSTDDLKIKGREYADFYIRRNSNIILIQAKRTFLPQKEFKEVYSIEDYKKLNKDSFYSRFGLFQLVDTTIAKLNQYITIIDPKVPKGKLSIFPVLLINESIISFPVAAAVFNKKFKELLKQRGIPMESEKYLINELIILHISELERIQQSIKDGDIILDEFFEDYLYQRNPKNTGDPYSEFSYSFDNHIRKNIFQKAIPNFIIKEKKGIIEQLMKFGQKEGQKNI